MAAAKRPRTEPSALVCRHFLEPDGCRDGSRCPYTHPGERKARLRRPVFRLLDCVSLSREARRGSVGLTDILGGPWSEALLINFQVDIEFLCGVCPLIAERPVTIAHGWKPQSVPEAELREFASQLQSVNVVRPKPEMYGTHHSKMAIVFHEEGVRVAVLSANYVPGDFAFPTQSAFVQDFPRKTDAGTPPTATSEFEDTLVDYVACTSATLRAYCERLREFDFSSARALLVPSVPGRHAGEALHKYGHMRLRRLLSRGLSAPPDVGETHLAMQFSSLGSLDEDWFANQFQGSMVPRGAAGVLAPAPRRLGDVHVVYPTVAQVRDSNIGYAAGGSLPAHAKNLKPFLVRRMRRWDARVSGRERASPHIKTYVRFQVPEGGGECTRVDYVLTGSHNLSKAAWGQLQVGNTKLFIRSFEMSVLFLPDALADVDPAAPVFSLTPNHAQLGYLPEPAPCDYALGDTEWGVPLPYRLPPERYRAGERPWAVDGEYLEPDAVGEVWRR